MKNSIFLLIILSIFSCSKENIIDDVGLVDNISLEPIEYVYDSYSNFSYSLTSYENKIPDLFLNSTNLMFGIEYPSDKVILDYNNDGYMDFIHTDSDYMSSYNGVIVRNYITFYLGDENGNLYLDEKNNNKYLGMIHGKKGIVSDFNGDSFPDVFFAGTGLENGNPSFEYPIALINNKNGEFTEHRMVDLVGYWHSVTSSDIDNDGKSEIILISPSDGIESIILDFENEFIPTIFNIPIEFSDGKFSQESIDINNDGYSDIILGSDYENNPSFPERILEKSIVLLNSPNGFNNIIRLPLNEKAKDFKTVLDINFYDLDLDGDLDIIISRTRQYNKPYIQILKNNITSFEDVSHTYIDNNFEFEGGAIEWLYVGDFNSDGIIDLKTNINEGKYLKWQLIDDKFILK